MKTITFIVFTSLLAGIGHLSIAQELDGYKEHQKLWVKDGWVTLYYKAETYGINFKVKNETSKYVHAKVYNVSAYWSDGKKRKSDVKITYVPPGKIGKGRYDHYDNYSKLKKSGWTFERWKADH